MDMRLISLFIFDRGDEEYIVIRVWIRVEI